MLLDELGTYLQTAGIGTVGTTLFKGAMPLDYPGLGAPDAMVTLLEMPGLPPVRTHDSPPSRYQQPVVQVLTRGIPYGYASARQTSEAAWGVLDGLVNTVLSGTFYLWIFALQDTFWLRTDDFHRPLFVFNIRIARAL